MNPIAPISINAVCHPQLVAIHGTVKGARMAPTLAPELNIPVANDLSFFGKYSAVALMAAGKLPASPKASTVREIINPRMETGTAANPIQVKTLDAAVPIVIA